MNGCSAALQQGRYTYQHNEVLLCLLMDIQKYCSDAVVFADINDYRASDAPLATIPPSIQHLHDAQECKSGKIEYQLFIS